MSIEIGQKYISKDGEVVVIREMEKIGNIDCIMYSDGVFHALTKCDFLEQYKPYEPEPVFEWQWAYITNSLLRWHISNYMTEEEFKTWQGSANSSLEYKRLDFTKRERK